MEIVGVVNRVPPVTGKLCQGCSGLPQIVTTKSRSLDGLGSGSPAFVVLAKASPVCSVLYASNSGRALGSFATLRISFPACLAVSKVGVSSGRLWRVVHEATVRSQSGLEEAPGPIEHDRRSLEVTYFSETSLLRSPPARKDRADDPSLNNPLLRQHRLGCGWFAVVMEWEGVIVEDDSFLERKAWTVLAEEESKRPPPAYMLGRAEGMKNEQAISEVFCWSRDYRQMKRLAIRKEELYEEMQGGVYRLRPGSKDFVETLRMHRIPIAVASTRPMIYLERAIEAVGMEGFFNLVLAAEDAHRGKPDPEMYLYAAERLGFGAVPERCMVFGNSNSSVEAAHDGRMKAVAVSGKHPVYELTAGDVVVRRLDELSVIDLKNLSDLDSPEFEIPEPELEMEVEEDRVLPQVAIKDW
ncbi:hypothetical protein KC19_VG122800 [Ceratodon purpureus]|uniref:Uncharacterized protein n=1 Tax=Ceratodon purpureus TaxID=3225 RepID=A0A8T0HPG0_CERPU|nr:hypothetical protein KC19_VG122800 [Ceratodon purpureus]KAG0572763.1 hypothetical protein KC19_VG122800 [Ceratodon purpureus]KAG0572764.1 hypothetical protein KC19_VG122800 [Ceratodon purpureus]